MRTSRVRRAARPAAVAGLAGALLAGLLVVFARGAQETPGRGDFGPASPAAALPAPEARRTPTGSGPPPAVPGGDGIPGEPTRLALPRLGLRAPVDPVGVAEDGQVEVPADPGRVGWYRFSPGPGSGSGSSVVVGHVDDREQGLGVLVALNEVRQGDRVTVSRSDGDVVSYEIVARRTVAKSELAGTDAFRRTGRPVLTLVTCTGPFLPERGGYQNNLVVTAVEVPA